MPSKHYPNGTAVPGTTWSVPSEPVPLRATNNGQLPAIVFEDQDPIAVISNAQGDVDKAERFARLSAAAPKLLEALEDLLTYQDDQSGSRNSEEAAVRSKARAAIAEAKGS
jgi:hypothetical protein